jgi:hypothetical protein
MNYSRWEVGALGNRTLIDIRWEVGAVGNRTLIDSR